MVSILRPCLIPGGSLEITSIVLSSRIRKTFSSQLSILTSSSASSLVRPLHFVNQKGKIKRTIKHYVLDFIQSWFLLFLCFCFLHFYVWVFCLHVWLLQLSIWYPQRSENGIRATTTGVTDNMSSHMGTENQTQVL